MKHTITVEPIENEHTYRTMEKTDAAYQRALERAYGRRAGDERYRMGPHEDAQCQAAREAYRDACEAWHAECRAKSIYPNGCEP